MRKTRYTEEQIIGTLKDAAAGMKVADVTRVHLPELIAFPSPETTGETSRPFNSRPSGQGGSDRCGTKKKKKKKIVLFVRTPTPATSPCRGCSVTPRLPPHARVATLGSCGLL